jgi:DNA transformation protein and related proteins
VAAAFFAFVEELFAGLGGVRIKRMFGGAGVYAQGQMFALLADDVIYLKVDDALKAALAQEGSSPFVWAPESGPQAGKRVEMGYWRLPEAAFDDPDLACMWARRALAVAAAAAATKKSSAARAPKPKPKSKRV